MPAVRRVIVIVFDGLRPDMVTPELMPRLSRFAAEGVWYREARSVFPSMTRVATTSIATGAPPRVHGVVGNTFHFPPAGRAAIIDTSVAADLALAETKSGGRFVEAETFGDRLAAAGKFLAVAHCGSAGSTYLINPRAAANRHWTFSIFGHAHTPTPQAVQDVIDRLGPLPPRNLPRFEEIDYLARVVTEHVLPVLAPDVALVWFNEPDTSFHYKLLGSPETRAVVTATDAAFGRILDAIAASPDAGSTAVIAASDHGQISTDRQIDVAALLDAEGLGPVTTAAAPRHDAAVTVTGGNMGEIRTIDGDRRRIERIASWLVEQPFTGMLLSPARNEVEGEIEGTFAHSLVGLDHGRAPDLTYVLRSSTGLDPFGLPGLGLVTGGVPAGGGMHGGLNRHELNTVLILGGGALGLAPVISDAPAGIIDIGPTVLALLGIPAPASMCGRSLASRELIEKQRSLRSCETGIGAFRQRFSFVSRGAHLFPMHGERI